MGSSVVPAEVLTMPCLSGWKIMFTTVCPSSLDSFTAQPENTFPSEAESTGQVNVVALLS